MYIIYTGNRERIYGSVMAADWGVAMVLGGKKEKEKEIQVFMHEGMKHLIMRTETDRFSQLYPRRLICMQIHTAQVRYNFSTEGVGRLETL